MFWLALAVVALAIAGAYCYRLRATNEADAAYYLSRPDPGASSAEAASGRLERLTLSRVAVHLKNHETVEGVVTGQYPDALCLGHASYYDDDGRTFPAEGEVVLPWPTISWVQDLTTVAAAISARPEEVEA